jgi:hypothetical protein
VSARTDRPANIPRPDLGRRRTSLFAAVAQFNIRHHDDKQHPDYAQAFRDWAFSWYLAIVELTDRILDRQQPPSHGPA